MLVPFDEYEVINPDWLKRIEEYNNYKNISCDDRVHLKKAISDIEESSYAFENLIFYYIYRFLMQAVYEDNATVQIKKAVVAYIVCRTLCESYLNENKNISKEVIADIFHLYSRQFEHSYVNYECMTDQMENSELYSNSVLIGILSNIK